MSPLPPPQKKEGEREREGGGRRKANRTAGEAGSRVQCTHGLLEGVLVHNSLVKLDVEGVTGGHDVVAVDDLDKGLHAAALRPLLLAHVLCDLAGCLLKTNNKAVAKLASLVTVVHKQQAASSKQQEAAIFFASTRCVCVREKDKRERVRVSENEWKGEG